MYTPLLVIFTSYNIQSNREMEIFYTGSNIAASPICDPILENHPYRGIFEF